MIRVPSSIRRFTFILYCRTWSFERVRLTTTKPLVCSSILKILLSAFLCAFLASSSLRALKNLSLKVVLGYSAFFQAYFGTWPRCLQFLYRPLLLTKVVLPSSLLKASFAPKTWDSLRLLATNSSFPKKEEKYALRTSHLSTLLPTSSSSISYVSYRNMLM